MNSAPQPPTPQRHEPRNVGNRFSTRVARLVFVFVACAILAGCIGESRVGGANSRDLVGDSGDSPVIARLQGEWRGQAKIGSDSIPEVVEFYRSTTSVTIAGERSPVAVFDVLEHGDDWIRIVVKHPTGIAVTTVRFLSPDRFWLEHYPNTIYSRLADSETARELSGRSEER